MLAAGGWATPASAEVTSTAQARIANAEFLATAVPPGPAAGVCLVDTGVDVNPDTSHVIARLQLSGSDGSDGDPARYGTRMAMLIGAGRNGFGTVGMFPAVRLVSVRATPVGSGVMNAARYINAIKLCLNAASGYGLKVIELGLSFPGPLTPDESSALSGALATSRARGMTVVAAAGDTSGAAVEIPANQPGVLSVGGSDGAGQRCATSAKGALVQAPGCGLDEADPATGQPMAGTSGTSQASAVTAAAVAALMSWRPELTGAQVEQALIESARRAPGGPSIDVAAAFRRLGLGAVVDANQPVAVSPLEMPSVAAAADPPPQARSLAPRSVSRRRTRLPRPLVRLRTIRGYRGVLVSVRNRPRGTVTAVSAYRVDTNGSPRRVARRSRVSARVAVRVNGWDELRVRFLDPSRARAAGAAMVIVHPRQR